MRLVTFKQDNGCLIQINPEHVAGLMPAGDNTLVLIMGQAYTLAHPHDMVSRCLQDPSGHARNALIGAADQFKHYEALHRNKHTLDGDAKAITNRRYAQMCETALGHLEGRPQGDIT